MLRVSVLSLLSVGLRSSVVLVRAQEKSFSDVMTADNWKNAKSVYEFHAKDIDGGDQSLEKYKGKVLIIVNGACKCGYTAGHYKQLQDMFKKYESDGLAIALFPSNQFGSQEPWPEPQIKEYVKGEFGVTFDLYSKIDVNGDNAHPLYKWLKTKQGGTLIDAIKWNFTKFLVDRNGEPVGRWAPNTEPKDIEKDVLKLLGVSKKEEL